MNKKPVWKICLSILGSLGLALLMLTVASASVSYLEGEVDLTIDLNAPQHVKLNENLVINLAYGNIGALASPDDTWVRLTLPAGVSFVSAVDSKGVAMIPIIGEGNTYTWTVGSNPCRIVLPTHLCNRFGSSRCQQGYLSFEPGRDWLRCYRIHHG